MPEEPFAERLKRLEDRIAAARAGRAEPQRGHRGEFTQGSLAWRMVIELVVGMLLGLAIGWGLDALFGTRPVFLVVFALRCAGVFIAAGTTRALRSGLIPRWFAGISYAVVLILLLTVARARVVTLLFPAWVVTMSMVVLMRRVVVAATRSA